MAEKLRSEKAGILNWMLRGWREVGRAGLGVPHIVSRVTEQLFNDRNELNAFFEDCVERTTGAKVALAELYQAYATYCNQDGIDARGQREFGRLLRTVFKVDQGRTGSTRYWKDISLKAGAEDTNDHCLVQPLAELIPD